MSYNIIHRLKKLEQASPSKLLLLCSFCGVERECTIEELEANPDACFIKVLKGNNISEVDKVLKHIEIAADRMIDDEQRLVKAN